MMTTECNKFCHGKNNRTKVVSVEAVESVEHTKINFIFSNITSKNITRGKRRRSHIKCNILKMTHSRRDLLLWWVIRIPVLQSVC